MFPILYEQITSGVIPQHNGLGVLSDAISCVVEQERNGIYELTMEYPISGIHAQELAKRRILKVKPNFTDAPQLFRIDRISGTLNGKFTVYAKHISYDLSGYVIARGTASNAIQAVNLLESAASGYNFDTDKNVTADFTITEPSSVRSWFGGKSGSFLDVFGKTELKYDNFNVHFLLNAGQDRGITIRYGKNLLALSQETDCNNLYTAVMCYFKEEDGTIIDGDEITTGLSLDVPKVMVIDCSDDFDEIPTVQELNQKAQQYINNNNLTLPTNNITLDFVQSGELSNRVDLCDTVSIYYEALGITRAHVKCIRVKWDCLKERYIETEFGDVKNNLTNTVIEQQLQIAETQSNVDRTQKDISQTQTAITAILGDIDNLQDQIDGNITTWYYDYTPTLNNAPANTWQTTEDKNNHIGDLFYEKSTGYAYRFMLDNSTYKWVRISDEDISTALAAAQNAQDTADNKRRVFVTTPVPPYDVGDLWTNGNDIYYCSTAKTSSQAYAVTDWVKASNYVNPSAMATAINDATSLITGNSGGYVVLHDTNNDGKPDEILIMDAPTIATATKVWRWNNAGLAYSSTGYSGSYATAIYDGHIVADFINTGTLNANLIKAGVISDAQGNSTIDMANGLAKLYELSAIKGFNILTEGDEDIKATFTATQFGADFILSPLDAYDYPFAKIETLSRQNESYSNFKLSNDGETYTTILRSDSTGGNVEVYNASGVLVAEMFARESGVGGTVRTKNNDGTTAVSMYTTDSGGNVKVGNSTGNDRVFIWVGGNDDGVINVFDTNGNPTVTFEGATGKIHCQRIQPYDPDYSVDNASGTMHLDASGWEVRRMGNVVYMAIPFKGTGVNVPAGSTAFTGTLADGDLPAIPCNMIAYYSGDVFILNIKANGEMTLRNCGAARTFSTNQGITICGSFIVD